MKAKLIALAAALLLSPCALIAQEIAAPAAPPSPPAASHELAPTPAPANASEIMRRAVEKDIVNWQAAKDYTFLEHTVEETLDGDGRLKSSKTETREILVMYGEPFDRLVAKDDKPLPEKEQKKQDEEFEKETRKRQNETPEEREKRLKKYEKDRQEERAFVREVLDAYDFSLAGEETLNGRKTWVIDATQRPGFEGKRRESKMLPKIKPRFWIDQQDDSWVRLRAEFTDTVSFGWVVARLHKGSVFEIQQVRVNNEVWLPQRVDVKLDARVALLKGINANVHVTYKDYRKFRTETKISLAEGEAQP